LQPENFAEKMRPAFAENEKTRIKKFDAYACAICTGTPLFPVEGISFSALEAVEARVQRKLRFFCWIISHIAGTKHISTSISQ